jgi:hypothetical protein
LRIESTDARVLVAPDSKPNHRVVELDAINARLPVTYVFVCVERNGYFGVSPMGGSNG